MRFAALIIVLAVSATTLTGTLLRKPDSSAAQKDTVTDPSELQLTHDVGTVIEGTTIDHPFAVHNGWQVPISIETDDDIHKSCGCLKLEPAQRTLPAGQTTSVRMRVATSGKRGRLGVNGVIDWHGADGRVHPIRLTLRGKVEPALLAAPNALAFEPDQITANDIQTVHVSSSVKIDWSTLRTHVEPPYAAVATTTPTTNGADFGVRALPPADATTFAATLYVSAQLTDAPDHYVTAEVLIGGRQQAALRSSPSSVFAKVSAKKRTAAVSLLLHSSVTDGALSNVACDGFHVEWTAVPVKVHQTDEQAYRVTAELAESAVAGGGERGKSLKVTLASGGSIAIPIYFIESTSGS